MALAAVQENWRALQYASDGLKNDNDVLLAAMQKDAGGQGDIEWSILCGDYRMGRQHNHGEERHHLRHHSHGKHLVFDYVMEAACGARSSSSPSDSEAALAEERVLERERPVTQTWRAGGHD